MKRYIRDNGTYIDIVKQLKEKYHDSLGHIFVDEILIMVDDEFEVKLPKTKKGEEITEEQMEKYKEKKRKSWKFSIKTIPQLYQDALDSRKLFVIIARQRLIEELSDEQVVAFLYSELRKISNEYKLQKPDVNTFFDLVKLLGRTDWEEAYDIPNLLSI
jgi:hypothetical protein